MFWNNLLAPRQTSPKSIHLESSFPPVGGYRATGSSLGVLELGDSPAKMDLQYCDASLKDLALFIREIFSRQSDGSKIAEKAGIIEITVGFYSV